MLPTLETSEKFKTEFDNFKLQISKITNDSVKNDLNEKLTQLLRDVRFIDAQHQEILLQKQISSMVTEARNRLLDTRKYITKKLQENHSE